jgi:hypothetical protein
VARPPSELVVGGRVRPMRSVRPGPPTTGSLFRQAATTSQPAAVPRSRSPRHRRLLSNPGGTNGPVTMEAIVTGPCRPVRRDRQPLLYQMNGISFLARRLHSR